MMIKTYDKSIEVNYNLRWHYILNHHYKILIAGVLTSVKSNVLLNFMYMPKVHENKTINCSLREEKKYELKN